MKDDVRTTGPLGTEEDIHITSVPESFRAFAEEVRKRNIKPRTTPLTLPQKLAPADFNTAMVHFYRGEIQRSNIWRNRLDATTNWAVITGGGGTNGSTVTVKLPVAGKLNGGGKIGFVAVQLTVVVPIGNVDPLGGRHSGTTGIGPPKPPLTHAVAV